MVDISSHSKLYAVIGRNWFWCHNPDYNLCVIYVTDIAVDDDEKY